MSTGIKWRAVALAAGISFTLFFTGCGGGGDGDGTVAPESLEGRSYDFSPNTGGQTAVTFASSSSYTFMHESGAVDQGTYESARNGNTWTATLTSETGGQQVYTLNFGTASGGTFTLRREGEDDRFGPFSARGTAVPVGNVGTTTGDPNPDPGSTTTPAPTPSNEYNGFAPVSIAGRVLAGTRTQTSTGPVGQTHTYTFGNGTFHDSDGDEQADGTYTYVAGNSTATLNLVYTAPQIFNGDKHDLTMTFNQKDRGRFTSTYTRADQTQITISGDFVFDPIP